MAGFPNLFLLVGPNTAPGHNSIVYIIESQIDSVVQALDSLGRQSLAALEARPEAQAAYSDALQAELRESVWVQGGCTSSSLDAQGRNNTLWPGRAAAFRRALRRFDPGESAVRLSPTRLAPLVRRGGAA